MTEHFLHSLSDNGKRQASFPVKRLSDREIEVFELMGNGKSTQEIARQLHISPRTVDAHRARDVVDLRVAYAPLVEQRARQIAGVVRQIDRVASKAKHGLVETEAGAAATDVEVSSWLFL